MPPRTAGLTLLGIAVSPGRRRMAAEHIDDVIEALAAIVRQARTAGDRLGYFAALYRQVTVEVRTAMNSGFFDDPARMDRFDTVFGNRYFDALDAWRRDRGGPHCWREAFELTGNPDTIIVQHLVLGVNAHINLDLAVAAAEVCPGDAIHGLRHDFLLINDILSRVWLVMQDAVGEVSPYLWLLDRFGGRADEWVLDFSLRRARQEAWHYAVVLARPAVELIRATESDDVPAVIARLDRAMETAAAARS